MTPVATRPLRSSRHRPRNPEDRRARATRSTCSARRRRAGTSVASQSQTIAAVDPRLRTPCVPERSSAACPAAARTATTSPPTRSTRARSRCSSSASVASMRPQASCRRRPRRHGPRRRRLPRPPVSRALHVVGVTGTNGKTTTTHLLGAIFDAQAGRPSVIGTPHAAPAPRRRPRSAGPTGRVPRRAACRPSPWRCRRTRSCSTGSTASVRRRGVHQPQPGPPRLPRHDGGLLRGQGVAVRAGPRRARPSSTPTTGAACGSSDQVRIPVRPYSLGRRRRPRARCRGLDLHVGRRARAAAAWRAGSTC